MDLLEKLERTLEGIVEGVFSRAFKTPLQPVEVAKRLTREMESHRTVSVNATYVPNHYTVSLSPETYQEFQAISGRLLDELTQYLRDFMTERQYQTVGSVSVHLEEDAGLRGHEMQITATSQAEAMPYPAAPARPVVERPAPPSKPVSATATLLEVTEGEAQGTRLPLANGLTIGRGPTNTLALHEPGVSRQHAEIRLVNQAWEVHDLGSTNGTFVNTQRVASHRLAPGDTIRIGHTTIVVR